MNDPLWYKDAVIYEAHVKSFFDSNNDGIGDFKGLTQKLDYLQGLGVTCLWLLPFFPSPLKDDGYDVADYRNVHPSYGTLDDFTAFVDAAHERAASRSSSSWSSTTRPISIRGSSARATRRAGSPERDFYVWSDTDKKFPETRIIFSDTEKSNWTWDPVAGQYYWHRFFSHQPDLNHNNPAVVDAVIDVMRFWLDRGVDALRLDAVAYLCVREGTSNENLPETHDGAEADAARARRGVPEPDAARGSEPVAVRRPPVLRRRRRVPHGVSLPADAAHVHGAAAGGSARDHRDPQPDARHPGDLRSGRCSCATTTS